MLLSRNAKKGLNIEKIYKSFVNFKKHITFVRNHNAL